MQGEVESRPIRIAVDIMGSEKAPLDFLKALKAHPFPPSIELTLIGSSLLESEKGPFSYLATDEVIELHESPLVALRKKKKASMLLGMHLLKEEKVDAFVSAGNTGAMMASAKTIVGTLPKIFRPALIALLPTKKKPVAVLDLGASARPKTGHMIQFAYLGAAYQIARGIEKPTIGILNIGAEEVKGTKETRALFSYLKKRELGQKFLFGGNIEGKNAFDGEVDVLVTDGFTGNVFLKTAEGIANLILERLFTHLPHEIIKKIQKDLEDLKKHLHYAEYPGALFAGLNAIVIKCHSYSTPEGFVSAVKQAALLVRSDFQKNLRNQIDKILLKG